MKQREPISRRPHSLSLVGKGEFSSSSSFPYTQECLLCPLRNGYLGASALCGEQKSNACFLFLKLIYYFCRAWGEKSLGQECVSCFYPCNEIGKISAKRVGTMRRSFCLRICKRCTAIKGLYTFSSYMLQRGVFVSQFIFLRGVCRYQLHDERDKSLRFSCMV